MREKENRALKHERDIRNCRAKRMSIVLFIREKQIETKTFKILPIVLAKRYEDANAVILSWWEWSLVMTNVEDE